LIPSSFYKISILVFEMRQNAKFIFFLSLFPFVSFSQEPNITLGTDLYHTIDRLNIKYGYKSRSFHTTIKPFSISAINSFIDSIGADSNNLSGQDVYSLDKLKNIQSKKPVLKWFYTHKKDFYFVNVEDFELHVNPVIYLQYGKEGNVNDSRYINTRGVEISGLVSKKVGFYSFIAENQVKFPTFLTDMATAQQAVPGEGYYKDYFKGSTGFDFFTIRGYFTLNVIKNIDLQFGHDKNFIGYGYRSLVLSDQSSNYLFLKLNTKVWKINYQNIFTELISDYARTGDRLLDKKYAVIHHLNIKLRKNLDFGLFETVVFGRNDTTKAQHFELNYFNPIIFYRSVEQAIGSPDNASMGVDLKYNFLNHFSLYSQFYLDDFNVSEFKKRNGWWGNKLGFQSGLKYIDVANINNLDLQVEYNTVRPYTYTHNNKDANYTHYNQTLAHPLGANFKEFIGILRYYPIPKLGLKIKFINASYGADSSDFNWGSNIFIKIDKSKIQEYNTKVLQGVTTNISLMEFTITYEWKPNIYLDLKYLMREVNNEVGSNDQKMNFIGMALRMNIPERRMDY